jgi:hypothetical protein
MQEAVAFFREVDAQAREDGYTGPFRIYVSRIGTFDQLSIESEHESLAEYEKAMARWSARPGTPEFLQRAQGIFKGGGRNEIWRVPD